VTRRTDAHVLKHWLADTYEAGRFAISVAIGIIFDRISNDLNTVGIPYVIMGYALVSVVILNKLPRRLFPKRIGGRFVEALRWYRGVFCGALFGSTFAFVFDGIQYRVLLAVEIGVVFTVLTIFIMVMLTQIIRQAERKIGVHEKTEEVK